MREALHRRAIRCHTIACGGPARPIGRPRWSKPNAVLELGMGVVMRWRLRPRLAWGWGRALLLWPRLWLRWWSAAAAAAAAAAGVVVAPRLLWPCLGFGTRLRLGSAAPEAAPTAAAAVGAAGPDGLAAAAAGGRGWPCGAGRAGSGCAGLGWNCRCGTRRISELWRSLRSLAVPVAGSPGRVLHRPRRRPVVPAAPVVRPIPTTDCLRRLPVSPAFCGCIPGRARSAVVRAGGAMPRSAGNGLGAAAIAGPPRLAV